MITHRHTLRWALCLAMLLPLCATAQIWQQPTDTAAAVVDRYLRMLNIEALPQDSLLELRTEITFTNSADTFVMLRWYQAPQQLRLEVRRGNQLQTGLCSNGADRFRMYKADLGYWVDIRPDAFHERLVGYDFRGPLHGWRAKGAKLQYMGMARAMGEHMLEAVRVDMPGQYVRYYFFEPTGLLTLIVETDEIDVEEYKHSDLTRIDWKIVHEYMQVGNTILPRQESFLRNGALTIMQTTARLLPRNNLVFNIDKL